MVIFRAWAPFAFGTTTVSRPSANDASIFSASTNSGSRIALSKVPWARSAEKMRNSPSCDGSKLDGLVPRTVHHVHGGYPSADAALGEKGLLEGAAGGKDRV